MEIVRWKRIDPMSTVILIIPKKNNVHKLNEKDYRFIFKYVNSSHCISLSNSVK